MNITPDYSLLASILDRPIAFHRIFATISGSVLAGLMLSQAYYWTPRGEAGDGWFYKTQAEWEKETGMSRWEQETARKKLLEVKTKDGSHVWEEERRGLPAKLYYRLNVPALFECIFGDSIEAAIKNAGLPHTGMAEQHNQGSGDPTDQLGQKPQSFYNTENTTESTRKNKRPPSGRSGKKARGADTPGTKFDLDHYDLSKL